VTGTIFTRADVNSARLADLVGEAEAVDLDKTVNLPRAVRK
jgi:hypothetical protein